MYTIYSEFVVAVVDLHEFKVRYRLKQNYQKVIIVHSEYISSFNFNEIVLTYQLIVF